MCVGCLPQVGLLRVVMSLQENGPAEPTGAAAASLSKAAGSPLSRNPSKQRQQKPANQPAAAADGKEPTGQGQQLAQQAVQPAAAAAAAVAAAAAGGGGGGVVSGPQGSGQLPEFLVAWELEVWRKVRPGCVCRMSVTVGRGGQLVPMLRRVCSDCAAKDGMHA
jgi:hypothetical protein